MYYSNVNDLPMTLRESLPAGAQEIYRKTYNRVWDEHTETDKTTRAIRAHQQAWDALQREYVLVQDTTKDTPGGWHRIGAEPTSAPDTPKRGWLDRLGLRWN
jgi:cation transport regulator